MSAQKSFTQSPIYNSVQKVQAYWDQFKPKSKSDETYQQKWLAQGNFFDAISLQSRVCITLWDVQSNRFIYVSDPTKVLGDNAANLLPEDGIDYTFSHFPQDCLDGVLKCQQEMIDYCIKHPEYLPFHVVGNMDTRYNTNKGSIHYLQQVSVVEVNEEGHPLLFLSYLYDITHLKKEPSLSIVINSPSENFIRRYNFRCRLLETVEVSAKEHEVLQLLSMGKHSKEIASMMNISPNTVDTHRRNLLLKTCCVDTTALVSYCRMVGLI